VIEGSPPSGRFDSPDDAAHATPRNQAEFGAEAPVEATRDFDAYMTSPDAPGDTFPWPPAEGTSVAGAFVQTWQGATFQPSRFYRALTDRTSLGSALLYYLPLGILIAGAELFWRTVGWPSSEPDAALAPLGASEVAIPPLVSFLLSPLLLIVSLFLSAAVTHALLKLFGGASRDYSTTSRVFAFAYSPMIFSVVPVVGSIIGFPWMIVTAIIGLRHAQRTSTGRAAAAVLIPVVTMAILLIIYYVVRAATNVLETPL
jgi:hypothetical protein